MHHKTSLSSVSEAAINRTPAKCRQRKEYIIKKAGFAILSTVVLCISQLKITMLYFMPTEFVQPTIKLQNGRFFFTFAVQCLVDLCRFLQGRRCRKSWWQTDMNQSQQAWSNSHMLLVWWGKRCSTEVKTHTCRNRKYTGINERKNGSCYPTCIFNILLVFTTVHLYLHG